MAIRYRDHGVFFNAQGELRDVIPQSAADSAPTRVGPQPPAGSAVVPGKLLQSHQSWAALVGFPSGRLLCIRSRTANWMQLLGRTTGECISYALQDSSGVHLPAASRFEAQVRVTTTDGAASNARAEQAVVRERGGDWQLVHLTCEVHMVATCFKHAFSLVPGDTKGALHLALALRAGTGAYKLFRWCLRQVIDERLVFTHDEGSDAAQKYRHASMSVFLPGSENKARRAVLEHLARGDWRDRRRVFCISPSRAGNDAVVQARLREECMNHLVWALLPKAPEV